MEEFAGFIRSLGSLHDAEIVSLTWTPSRAEILMSVKDINANFEGTEPTPGVFIFSGVTDVEWAVDRPDPKLKIYDWDVAPIDGGHRSEIQISPSGRLVIQCAAIVLAPPRT
ncbi:MAG: hypothetical protein J0H61_13145 [Alphaproteobacteria bacterium]|nr:hypothetical protein [Alphaproteobacteria bacterium]